MPVWASKALSQARARLFGEIMKVIDSVCIHKVDPIEVDDVLLRGLNRLEAKVMASVINTIGAEKSMLTAVMSTRRDTENTWNATSHASQSYIRCTMQM